MKTPHTDAGVTRFAATAPASKGLFARIERWTNAQTGDIHWRSISKDNITTLYGKTQLNSRIVDPATRRASSVG